MTIPPRIRRAVPTTPRKGSSYADARLIGCIPFPCSAAHELRRVCSRLDSRDDGQVAPACRSLNANGDDGILCNLHGAELRIAGTQQRLRLLVFCAAAQDFGTPAQHDPAEPCPILIVAVDDQR